MTNKYDFYLAHPLKLRIEVRDKLQIPLKEIGFQVANPFYDEELVPRQKVQMIERGEITEYGFNKEKAMEIVQGDLDDIKDSAIIIAYLPEPSIGTSMEIFYASHILKKAVLGITPYGGHPWIQVYAAKVWPTIEDFMAVIGGKR